MGKEKESGREKRIETGEREGRRGGARRGEEDKEVGRRK